VQSTYIAMKNVLRSPVALTLLASLAIAPVAYAQDAGERARFDELARTAAQQFAEARIAAEAEQTRPTTPPTAGTVVELALDDAV
jgi:hypothetical protein